MLGGSAKREMETSEKATSHGKAPSRESDTKGKEGSLLTSRRIRVATRRKKMKKWSTTRPTHHRPPHPAPTPRPSPLSAMSTRSIVRCHFVIPVSLSVLLYSPFH
jgi:hypothetical protein